jgi:single stranded DNA-binding protein
MRDINEVKILGTVTQPVRVNPTKSGSVANISVVTIKKRGEYDIKKFHNVTCWNDLAQEASALKEGDRVFVSGSMETDSYDKDGVRQYKDKITAQVLIRAAASSSAPLMTQAQGGPPGSFSGGGGRKSTFPYADTAHKVSWPKPDESGFSYAEDGIAQLCVAWTNPSDPSQGGTVYQFADNDWQEHGQVDQLLIKDDDIPF